MTVLRLIADDLTGALDSAAQFTGLLGPVPVLLGASAVTASGSVALDLACRDGTEARAVARTLAAAPAFDGAGIAFKKIDSLLRGHWAAELAALAARGMFRAIVLAPAFPAQGRRTRLGRQEVRDGEGRWSPLALDPGAELRRRGLPPSGPDDIPSAASQTALFLCDALTQQDLEDVVRRFRAFRGPVLWCGTAGLARALAGQPPAPFTAAAGAHLVVIGTNHPVTLAQAARLPARWFAPFGLDGPESGERIARVLSEHGRCVAAADLPPGLMPADAAIDIARRFRAAASHIPRPGMMTVIGGETFAMVAEALGAGALSVDGEHGPGVPASRMRGGVWDGLRCVSKSGAFGAPSWLAALLAGAAPPTP